MEKNLKKNIHIKLNHVALYLKLIQHCKSTVLPFKKKRMKEGSWLST